MRPGTLLATGFGAMGLAAVLAFADFGALADVPPAACYAAMLGFWGFGGPIPATLFALALRVAPGPQTVATTVGWLQQWSA
ncbi:MAG: MFS transporter, partial [Chitinophagaceae bacterium]|nr:MFS transporter [Rubrivivax sp.]